MKHVVRQLEVAGLEYMVSGSVASSLQGEPRASHDIDIVVAVRAPAAEVAARLKAAFPEPDFDLDESAMREAIIARSMFNLLDTRDALRVWEVQHGRLDEGYLDRWAQTLGVTDALTRLRREAQPLE